MDEQLIERFEQLKNLKYMPPEATWADRKPELLAKVTAMQKLCQGISPEVDSLLQKIEEKLS